MKLNIVRNTKLISPAYAGLGGLLHLLLILLIGASTLSYGEGRGDAYFSANTGKDTIYNIFQFPADKIPRIDGNIDDWNIVPDSYIIGTNQLWDDSRKHEGLNRKSID